MEENIIVKNKEDNKISLIVGFLCIALFLFEVLTTKGVTSFALFTLGLAFFFWSQFIKYLKSNKYKNTLYWAFIAASFIFYLLAAYIRFIN